MGLCKWGDEVWGFIIPDNFLMNVCEMFKITYIYIYKLQLVTSQIMMTFSFSLCKVKLIFILY